MRENVIEWVTGDSTMTLTLTQQKHITLIRKLASKRDDVIILAENKDGSILAKAPLKALKFNIVERELTDEQRAEMAERLKKNKEKMNGNDDLDDDEE